MSKKQTKTSDIRWTDLGLPSGRLWAFLPQPSHCTRKEAEDQYGKLLPDKEALIELSSTCTVDYDVHQKTYVIKVEGGDKLNLKAGGYKQGLLTKMADHCFCWMKEGTENNGRVNVVVLRPNAKSPLTFATAGGNDRCSLLLATMPGRTDDRTLRGGKVLSLKNLMKDRHSADELSDSFVRECWKKMAERYSDKKRLHALLLNTDIEVERGKDSITVRYTAVSEKQAEWFNKNILFTAKKDLTELLGLERGTTLDIAYKLPGAGAPADPGEDPMDIATPPEPAEEKPRDPEIRETVPAYMLQAKDVDRYSMEQIRGMMEEIRADVARDGIRLHEGHGTLYDKCFEWLLDKGYIIRSGDGYATVQKEMNAGYMFAAWEMFPSGARMERADRTIVLRITSPTIAALQPRSEFEDSLKHIYNVFKDGNDDALNAARGEGTFLVDMEVFLWAYFNGVITGHTFTDGSHLYRWVKPELTPNNCLLEKMTRELTQSAVMPETEKKQAYEAPAGQKPLPAPAEEEVTEPAYSRETIDKYRDMLCSLQLITCGKGCPAKHLGKHNLFLIDILRDMKVLKNTGTESEPVLAWDDIHDPSDEKFIRTVLRLGYKKYFVEGGENTPTGEGPGEAPSQAATVQSTLPEPAPGTERVPLSEFSDKELFEAFKAMGGFIKDSKAYYKLYLI